MTMEFRLPALGEGIDSATVVGILVKPGDSVGAEQSVLSVETDKAAVEVPIDRAGTVASIAVKPGDKIPIGALILTLGGAAPVVAPPVVAAPEQKAPPTPPVPAPVAAASPPAPVTKTVTGKVEFQLPPLGEGIDSATVVGVLIHVGDQVVVEQNVLSVETDKAAVEVPIDVAGTVTAIHVKPGDKIPIGSTILTVEGTSSIAKETPVTPREPVSAPATPVVTVAAVPETNGTVVAAGPATRRLARELGVKLAEVRGTARFGRVTIDDVKEHVRGRLERSKNASTEIGIPPLPDFSKYGEIERIPATTLRKKIAENLTIAWRTIPMVTQFDSADITDLETGRKRIADATPKGTAKITWTVLAVKGAVAALKEFPQFNSSFDMAAGELIRKKYFHIGIAVDTERGLVVPVIRDADKKSIRDIATEVAALAEKARAGKLSIDEMRGGTFTITNLGGIGGTAFTPIVNHPEVAILGLSKSSLQAVVREGTIAPRLILPISLTYDHRVIDGADGARFAARLVQLFSDPIRLLMES